MIITRYLAAHIQFHHRHHHPRRHRRRTIVNASGNESASSAKGNVTITRSTRKSIKDRRVKLSWNVYHRNLGGRKSRLLSKSEVEETNGLIRGCDASPRAPFVAIRRPDDLVGNHIPLARRIHQRGMIFRSARRCSVSFNGRRRHIQDTLQKETTMVAAAAHLIGEKLFIFSYFIFIFYLYLFASDYSLIHSFGYTRKHTRTSVFLVLAVAQAVPATVLTIPYPGPVHHPLLLEAELLAKARRPRLRRRRIPRLLPRLRLNEVPC